MLSCTKQIDINILHQEQIIRPAGIHDGKDNHKISPFYIILQPLISRGD